MSGGPPPVLRSASRVEWAVVVAFIGVINLFEPAAGSLPMGSEGPVTGQAIRFLCWVAVLPAAFAGLDRLPLISGVWVRNLSLTFGLAVLIGLVHACGVNLLGHLAQAATLHPPESLVAPGALGELTRIAAGQFPVMLFLPHLALQRIHLARWRRRHQAETELSLLAAELRPHFIFNTLNAIAGMIHSDPNVAEAMLVRLSDLLRLTLEGAGQAGGESTLTDEIERLEHYVALQQMRFGPRLTVRMDLPADLGLALVPSLLLQPLVENALAHGVGPKPGPVTIAITGRRTGDRLILAVEDDGVGLAPDARARERIGVGNTRARLATLFPGDHRFELEPGAREGVRAVIDIPFRPRTGHARDHR